jgi:hypothetical protein
MDVAVANVCMTRHKAPNGNLSGTGRGWEPLGGRAPGVPTPTAVSGSPGLAGALHHPLTYEGGRTRSGGSRDILTAEEFAGGMHIGRVHTARNLRSASGGHWRTS